MQHFRAYRRKKHCHLVLHVDIKNYIEKLHWEITINTTIAVYHKYFPEYHKTRGLFYKLNAFQQGRRPTCLTFWDRLF